MEKRHLFLLGGSPPFGHKLGSLFAKLALNEHGKVAILFLERAGWEAYMSKYTSILNQKGIKEFVYLPINTESKNRLLKELRTCTGMIIGGGNTEFYRDYIVDTPIGYCIKEMYNQGIPAAGFSAGALISPEHCVIPPIDNHRNKHLFLKGLGLIKDCVISVHFSQWNEERNLKTAIETANVSIGFGIDDEEGLYFENENLTETEGDNFFIYKKGRFSYQVP
ncbi:peptidase S51 dipeptidase E [Bacillus sp. SA1-12]|uniref:Type 1 glutamine amidotransferase-like domain-containing protein n=1 Tax=Bacillus sp. SA1-12 TaxID=1455638 RepID=UPI0006252AF8|nr:Type 1 glutamine amidotransferase-like domain-containing protein [Bacillus sp. SA1-12]KKI92876.1 peptidase S51 dipeptidase E [Bacillus sp. SA1-12]